MRFSRTDGRCFLDSTADERGSHRQPDVVLTECRADEKCQRFSSSMDRTSPARSLRKQRTCQLLSIIYHHLRSTRLAVTVVVVVVFLRVLIQSDGYLAGCVGKRAQRGKREVIDAPIDDNLV